jgi:hypothetical protein
MSSRQIRRRQQQGDGAAIDDDEDADSDEAPLKRTPLFALLNEDNDEDGSDEDDTEDEVDEVEVNYEEASSPTAEIQSHSLSNKERRMQRKQAAAKEDLEEEALLVPSVPAGSDVATVEAEPPAPPEPWKLSPLHIDVSHELARRFGRQTVREAAADNPNRPAQQQGGGPHARGYEAAAARLRERSGGGGRGRLIKPRDEWPPLTGGLGMERMEHAPLAGSQRPPTGDGSPVATHFTFTLSGAYRRSQRDLEEAVDIGDPRALQHICAEHPYQADALLRLSDYLALAGQLEAAREHAERALYACEQAVHPMCRLLEGTARLSFDAPANRPFFVALQKHMVSAGRRACPRTALEVGRLLLSLDPHSDPMHALLHLDYYALRADEATTTAAATAAAAASSNAKAPASGSGAAADDCLLWLLQLAGTQLPAHSLGLYPNYAFSIALARRRLHERLRSRARRMDESDAQQATYAHAEAEAAADARGHLRRALLLFPAVLPLLLRGADGNAADGDARATGLCARWAAVHGAAASVASCGKTLGKLLALYHAKCALLWTAPPARAWLVAEAEALAVLLEATVLAKKRAEAVKAAGSRGAGGGGGGGGDSAGSAGSARGEAAAELELLDAEQCEARRLWADLATVREREYGEGSRAFVVDEFAGADVADFAPTPPDALPAEQLEELEMAADLGRAARQWVRAAHRPDAFQRNLQRQMMGRLVVPREEWVELDRTRHPIVQFFHSLLPWVVVTR